jgi:hypothetical protein
MKTALLVGGAFVGFQLLAKPKATVLGTTASIGQDIGSAVVAGLQSILGWVRPRVGVGMTREASLQASTGGGVSSVGGGFEELFGQIKSAFAGDSGESGWDAA